MNFISEMAKLGAKISAATILSQLELSALALEDCNKFCKVDTGETRASSYRASEPVKGRLIWSSKHARYAYYIGEADRSKNPLASRMWAHKAAALYQKKWEQTARATFNAAMKL